MVSISGDDGRVPPGSATTTAPDLDRRALATREIPAGTVPYRIHRTAVGALHVGPRTDPEERGRWDAPDDGYGVYCLAERGYTAFAETMLRELDREEISERGDLVPRSLARLQVIRRLALARMHGPGLRRMKATAAVVRGSDDVTWAWSHALHAHSGRVDGVAYRPCHDSSPASPSPVQAHWRVTSCCLRAQTASTYSIPNRSR
jgi:hypothetical protein